MFKLFALACLFLISPLSLAKNKPLIVAYVGADTHWQLNATQLTQLKEALQHVTHVNYAFVRFKADDNGNTVLNVTNADLQNLETIRTANPELPIILSFGGWGARDAFSFLSNPAQRKIFIESVVQTLKDLKAQGLKVQGIDVDWENELLAPATEVEGAGLILAELRAALGPDLLITNAVPATPAYWSNYPNAKLWASSVNWTTIMAYDLYGTFGPRAELASALYDSRIGATNKSSYPYAPTSGNYAIEHYVEQGLKPQQVLLGIPFYCHSYYLSQFRGLRSLVLDPNISSQVDYNSAFALYGSDLFKYKIKGKKNQYSAFSSYGIIPLDQTKISRFMSCESPQSISTKMDYVRGQNNFNASLAGVSFWSLMQDLPYEDENSLLKAMNQGSN